MPDDPHFATGSYFDREFTTHAVKILPGEYYATADATAITTLLGSCVSVCLFDPVRRVGGMNHFMLPRIRQGTEADACGKAGTGACADYCGSPCSARYGPCAMRHLLQRLDLLGAARSRLQAKLFGAGRVMAGMTDVGERNAAFALEYLREQGIRVVATDLGLGFARKVVFFPATGRAYVKRIRDVPAGLP